MPHSFLIVQLSDPHIGATWIDADPAAGLAAAVEVVLGLDLRPDALLLSGDLAESAADSEYELVRELTAPIAASVWPVAGNHDDRDALRRHFGLPGAGREPLQYAADLGPLRLVVLDSTVPGHDHGALAPGALAWLEDELRAAPETPTLLAIHHPPLVSGIPAEDATGLSDGERDALHRVLEEHSQVRRIVSGHMHRTIAGDLGGRPVLVAPSTYVGFRLDLWSNELRIEAATTGFAVHALVDGHLVSHVHHLPQS